MVSVYFYYGRGSDGLLVKAKACKLEHVWIMFKHAHTHGELLFPLEGEICSPSYTFAVTTYLSNNMSRYGKLGLELFTFNIHSIQENNLSRCCCIVTFCESTLKSPVDFTYLQFLVTAWVLWPVEETGTTWHT